MQLIHLVLNCWFLFLETMKLNKSELEVASKMDTHVKTCQATAH